MSESISRTLIFFITLGAFFLIYWSGGGDFERGVELGVTTACALLTGVINATLLGDLLWEKGDE